MTDQLSIMSLIIKVYFVKFSCC